MMLSVISTPKIITVQCPKKFTLQCRNSCRGNALTQRPISLPNASPSLTNGTSEENGCVQNPKSHSETARYVTYNGGGLDEEEEEEEEGLVSSASAVAKAIRKASTSPVEFVQKIEKDGKNGLVLPSSDFQRLCIEQLDLFRRVIDSDAVLSVYVRPAGSYVMDRLELRRVICYPGVNVAERADIVIIIGSFGVSTGLRAAEATLLKQQAEVIPECGSLVFPMVKHPFVVGFLVAELPLLHLETDRNSGQDVQLGIPPKEEDYTLPPCLERKLWEIQPLGDEEEEEEEDDIKKTYHQFTAEQRSNAINISRSLATAYVMDQKAMLLQQSTWQNNVRMSDLVEQIRGPLSSIRTLSKMLSVHMKKSEISYDVIEDILVQGDRMRDTLEQLQDAVYLTKANIVRYHEETLKKMHNTTELHPKSAMSQSSDNFSREYHDDKTQKLGPALPLSSAAKDWEMPMPPLALAAVQHHNIRSYNVSDVLGDLVGAARPLALKQQRNMELYELSRSLQVAVEESALRQALSNLIEGALLRTHVGGKVEIISTGAPAGGALVVIDDDGPDMQYMTQMHSLTPFGTDLFSEGMIEDSMTWNFVAGLTVAREILESYGCVVRVISPRTQDAAFGSGGTRIELWLPLLPFTSDPTGPANEL